MAGQTMRAIQLFAPGPASNLKLVDLPIPTPKPGQILIRVKTFGINRSDTLVRRYGRAPVGAVPLPRVLGVEAVGEVEEAPGCEDEFSKGAVVMTAVGGMGIVFDGGYSQFTCVSKTNVQVLRKPTKLGWDVLGALPVMLQTAHSALFRSLKLKKGDKLLVRGATSSVGLTAVTIAKSEGAEVIATTRRSDGATAQMLKDSGAAHVVVDDGGSIFQAIKAIFPNGVDKVLEMVGGSTMVDSLACLDKGGICCFLGIVGGGVTLPDFNPFFQMQNERYLTTYAERTFQPHNFPMEDLVHQIEDGSLKVRVSKVFSMDQIVEAHECMEKNEAQGKIVIMTGM